MLGIKVDKDGTTTYFGTVSGTAQLTGAISIESGQLGGTADMGFRMTYDADGTLSRVTYTYGTKSDSGYTTNAYTLPIVTDADRDLANQFLYNPNPLAWKPFQEAALQRGEATRLTYDTSGLDLQGAASIKAIEEGGLELGFGLPETAVASASYYDGTGWQPWTQCAG